jgi:hypothetical protein
MKTNNFLEQIQKLDFIEANNISELGKQINASPQEIHNLVSKIIDANKHNSKPKNKYFNFVFIGGDFVGIYHKYGNKIKEFFYN